MVGGVIDGSIDVLADVGTDRSAVLRAHQHGSGDLSPSAGPLPVPQLVRRHGRVGRGGVAKPDPEIFLRLLDRFGLHRRPR